MMRTVRVVALALLVAWASAPVAAANDKLDPFAEVPAEQRGRLVERLELFVRLHREGRWELVYDMLSEQARKAGEGELSRERFIRDKLYSRAIRFTPFSAQQMAEGGGETTWSIFGCAEYEERGRNPKVRSGLDAHWDGRDWYFTDIWSVSPCVDCPPRGCRL